MEVLDDADNGKQQQTTTTTIAIMASSSLFFVVVDWWYVVDLQGKKGWAPANYLEPAPKCTERETTATCKIGKGLKF